MAYEEVLFPYAMVGKKKYIGVQHQGIVNLAICMPECTLAEFMKSKSLFIRGLEIKKRGGSDFMKVNCYKVWKEAFCITETRTLREIVENNLQDIRNHNWNPSMFTRSKRYKLPEAGKPGNVSVLRFIDRMKYLEENRPELEVFCPEIGERFNIIIAKKYPWKYGITGAKTNIGIGDKMEYFESIDGEKSEKYRQYLKKEEGTELEIDIDYYMTGEICGQFARFLLYHPDYDHYFQDWMYEDDSEYKKADKKAHGEVKKTLVNYYNAHYASKYVQYGKVHQKVYKTVRSRVTEERAVTYGSDSPAIGMLDMLERVAFKSANIEDDMEGEFAYKKSKSDMETVLAKELIDRAKKLGIKSAAPLAPEVAAKLGISITEYQGRYFIPRVRKLPQTGKSIKTCLRDRELVRLQNEIRIKEKRIKKLAAKYKKISEDDMVFMGRIMKNVMQNSGVGELFGTPIPVGEDIKAAEMQMQNDTKINYSCIDGEFIMEDDEDKIQLIYQIVDEFYYLAALAKKLQEWQLDDQYLKDNARIYRKAGDFIPSSVNTKSENDSYIEWLRNKGSSVSKTSDGSGDLFFI
jgi:hypothetical protein